MLNIGLPQKDPVRIINLKIATDEEVRASLTWKSDIKKLVKAVSKDFDRHFGIQFKIKRCESWTSDNANSTTFDLLNDLRKKVLHDDCDIVVGFTAQDDIKNDLFGAATYLHGYIVIRELSSMSMMEIMLKHEICHLFGAADIHEKNSIMNIKTHGQEFDEFTSRIVLSNKFRSFNSNNFPLSRDKLEEAISIYEQRKILNPKETDIHFLLAIFYLEKQDHESTLRECFQVIQIIPDSPDALHLLGIAYRRQGKIDQALDEYQKVLHLQPSLPEIHYNLYRLHKKRNDRKGNP
ncbi:MAG: tetratricopeptide repeat protein [Candidatus Aminicenantes bacterium]|nr:tetratricopeptide repeat protein [Candidatus Aminicenantes bacterium]